MRSTSSLRKNPSYLLHGHEPLTRNFTSAAMLAQLKTDLTWLREQVLSAIRRGDDNATIQQANLIPPDLLAHHPTRSFRICSCANTSLTAFTTRTLAIGRRTSKGISHLSRADQRRDLVDYLGVSETQFVEGIAANDRRRQVRTGRVAVGIVGRQIRAK